ncbi:TonB-dependent receptor [Edaphobacter flagellatus]|uniref:TonB-dependent receptor n=1 Tax=Edaphobacter flagellatus TaxID=1933044 RepID=UPI0021B302C0|nr:TonB-dependent receptor [Edaphobacter flagellatus]
MKITRLLIILLVFLSESFAQTTSGTVSGFITDTSDSALADTTVTLIDEKTGSHRATTTNSTGHFALLQLPPSTYTLELTHAGFTTLQAKGLILQVGQEISRNFTLHVQSEQSTVTVEANTVALDTGSAAIGGNVATREIQELPINGRQISQLYLLVPGATNSGSGTFDNIRFSGRAVEQNIIRLDGIEATSIIDTSPGNLNGELTSLFRLQQSLEAVQEFRIDSSSYPAEMGTGTGGQISFITRSGSNHLHGSVFEYLRNDFFDARNRFNPKTTGNPKFRLNQFGGSIGGPIFKDKLFFFANYEGLRQIWAAPQRAATLSNYARSQVATNSPVYPLLAAFPADPNPIASELPVLAQSGGTYSIAKAGVLQQNVTTVGTNRINEDFGAIRFDYRINNRFSMYARYNRDQGTSSQIQDASLSQFGQVEVPQNGVLSFNQVWTPRIFNETKFGYNGIKMRVQGIAGPSPSADLSRARIAVAGLTNIGSLISLSSSFNGVGAPYTGQSYSYIDNLSFVSGNHSMKFGAEIRPLSLYNNQIGGTTYTYNSAQLFTGERVVAPNGQVLLNVAANQPSQIQFYGDLSDLSPFTGLSGNAQVKQAYYIGYAQDEWKLRPNLTLSYGLRYEYYSPLHEARNKNVFFDMNAGTIYPKYTGDWFSSSKTNFGPRLALTWSPVFSNGATVFRVGGGVFYGPGQTEDQIQPEANDRVTRTFTSGKAYPIVPATDVYANYDINSPTLGYQPRAYAPNYRIPERVTTYTASIQQSLPGQVQLMVGYVGSTGRNLFLRSITNLITNVTTNPTTGAGTAIRQFGGRFAEIDYKTSGGTDMYNALQTSVQRRFARGLSFGAQYTWAKELGTSSGSNEATTAQNPYNFRTEYGRGTFDIRHTLNATVLYDLPFGHGKAYSLSGPWDAIGGGWQVGGIVNFRSGLPMDVLITRPDIAYVGNPGTSIAGQTFANPIVTNGVVQTTAVANTPGGGNSRNIRRPNIVPGVNPYLKNGVQYLNPAAFTTPAPGTFGNYRRNDLTGPNLAQLDMTLGKSFRLLERSALEFRAEVYNILNHPNYANPGNLRLNQTLATAAGNGAQPGAPFTLSNAGSAGQLTSTVGNQVGIGANRQIQLSLRANF